MNAPTVHEIAHPCAVVVDDDPDAADTLAFSLSLSGMDVLVAYSAADCLHLVQAHHPAAVVSDLDMPRMSGLEEARALRSLPEGRDICLIALTGSHHLEAPAREAGFDHFFVKADDLTALTDIVRAACHPVQHAA